jgi:hypothetical protein
MHLHVYNSHSSMHQQITVNSLLSTAFTSMQSIKCWHVFFCPEPEADDDSAAAPEEPAAKSDAIPGPVKGKNAISDPVPDAVSHEPMDPTTGAETAEQEPTETISPDPAAAPLPIVIPATTTHKETSAEPEPALGPPAVHHHKSKAAAPAAAADDDDDTADEDDAEESEDSP